jgi:hypothetical protein
MSRTHTFAIADVSQTTYEEVRRVLAAAGYDHAFLMSGDREVIDMQGIALRAVLPVAAIETELCVHCRRFCSEHFDIGNFCEASVWRRLPATRFTPAKGRQ